MKPDNTNIGEGESLEYAPTAAQDSGVPTVVVPEAERRRLSPFRYNKLAFAIAGLAVLLITAVAVGSFVLFNRPSSQKNASDQATNYQVGDISLQDVQANAQLKVGTADKLAINGQLQVSNTLVLAPTAAPTAPARGQIYFDQATNQPYYYNGNQFVSLAPTVLPPVVNSIGGFSGAVGLGTGLELVNGQLGVSALFSQQLSGGRVTSLQGQIGDVQLVAGSGIGINGTTISNQGVINLNAGSGISVTADGNGVYTVTNTVVGLTGSGSAGQIAMFTGSQALGDSILSQSGSALTANGTLTVTGAISANTLQQTAPGLDVNISAGNDDLVFTAGGRTFVFPTSGPGSQTICTTGVSCASGGGQAVILQPGSVQTDTGSDESVFINNTGGGTLIRLQGNGNDRLVIANNGNTTIGGSLTVQGSGGLLVGVPGSTNGAITLASNLNTNTGSVQIASLGQNTIYTLPDPGSAAATICLSTGNCSGGGVTSFNGLTGALVLNNSSGVGSTITIDNASTSQKGIAQFNATNFTASAGTINTIQNIATTSAPTFGGLTLTSALTVANGGTGAGTFTSNGILYGNGTSALQATAAAANSVLVTNGSNVPSLSQTLPTAVQGNITGTGVLISGSIAAGFGTISTNSNISTTATVQGANVNATTALQLNGNDINNPGTLSNVAYENQANNFTQANTFSAAGTALAVTNNATIGGTLNGQTISSAANFTGTLAVQGAGGITVGIAGTTAGNLSLANSSSTRLVTIQGLNPSGTGNATIQFPSIAGGSTDAVCLQTLNNCAVAGGITGSGTTNYLARFTGTNTIGTGTLYDSGTAVSVGGTSPSALFNVGASNQFQVSSTGAVTAVGVNSGSGLIQGTGGLTVGGTITFSSLNSAGVVKTNGLGQLSTGVVALGTETSGDYVANLGTLTGLSTTGNSGEGSTPTLSVLYGSTANTAVQGNTSLTCASGTGNLSGGGNSITLGAGGSCNNITISNSPTFSGTVTVQGAGGVVIGVAGATTGSLNLANSANANIGTLQIASLGQATTFVLPDPGQASVNICLSTGNCAGSGGGITGSGTTGRLSKFSGSGTITDSTLSESGSTLTASGNLVIQGTNSLTLGVASSTDGSIAFKNNSGTRTVTLQAPQTDPAGDITFFLPNADGSNGDCLKTDGTGGLMFTACTGGAGGGVTSLNGQTGVVNINNASGSGGAITIDNASTSAKGIAQFNATNFTASSGTINTIQDIATTSSPTFAGLTLTNDLTVANGGTGASTFTSNGILYGNGTGALQVTAAAANSILVTNGSSVPSLSQTLPTAVQGNITGTGALTSGSIAAGFGTISTGNNITTSATVQGGTINGTSALQLNGTDINTAGTLTNVAYENQANTFTAANLFQNTSNSTTAFRIQNAAGTSNLFIADTTNTRIGIGTAPAYTLDVAGDVNTTGVYRVNGSQISSANLSNDANLAKLNGTNNFSAANTFSAAGTALAVTNNATIGGTLNGQTISSAANFTGTLAVQGGGGLTIGVQGSVTGNLNLANSTSSRMVILQGLNPSGTGNATVQIPTIAGGSTDTVCLFTLGNCALAGGISGSGTANYTARFTGANTIAIGTIYDDGSLVSVGGTSPAALFNVGASNQFQVSSTGAVTAVGVNSGSGVIQGTGGLNVTGGSTLGGTTTLSALGAGLVQSSSGGVLSSGAVDRNSATFFNTALTVANGGTGAATFTSNGILYGNGTGALQVTSAAANSILVTSGANVPSLSQTLPTAVQSNITGTGALTSGSIASGFGAISTGNNITSTATVQGGTVNGTSAIQLNGVDINTAGTLSNVAYENQANTFTQANVFNAAGTALSVTNNASIGGTLAVQGAGGLTLGVQGSVTGSLNLANSTSSRMVVLQGLNPSGTGNATVQIPTIAGGSTDTVCLYTLGNCSLAGAITGSGTANYTARFTAANTIAIGTIYDDGSLVSVGGTSPAALFNVGASNQFQVSSVGAVTAVGVNAGTGLIQGTGGLNVTGGSTLGGTTTLSALGAGLVQSSSGGVLSSGSVDRNSATFFNTALTVANGGTGASTFTSNGILYGNGTGALQVTAAAANSILVTNGSSVPSLSQTLPTAVQGNITGTGALTSGSIAAGFGTISTGNNITTSATVQGGTLNGTTAIQLNGVNINTAGTLSNVAYLNGTGPQIFTGDNRFNGTVLIRNSNTSGLEVGVNPTLSLLRADTTNLNVYFGNTTSGANTYYGDNNGLYVGYQTGTGSTIATMTAGESIEILSDSVMIAPSSADSTASFGVQNTGGNYLLRGDTTNMRLGINKNTAPAYTLDVAGDINTTGVYRVNGTQISSANLSNDSNLAKLNGANNFSAANTFSAAGTALSVTNNATIGGTLNVTGASTLRGGVTLGVAGSSIGQLIFAHSGNTNLGTVQIASLGQATTFTLPDPGGASATICLSTGNCAGAGTGITGVGTNGQLARFSSSNNIVDSTLSESGSVLTASGSLVIQGASSLTLGTASTNDGAIIFRNNSGANTVTLAAPLNNPASSFTLRLPSADGGSGECLVTDGSGNLSFVACGGGGGGVTSLDGQTGAVTIDNATGAGGVITIDNASTSQKGIAQFNSTNFTASSGTINTIQDIATTSSPTFATLNATSGLQLNGVNINTAGTLTNVAYENQANTFTEANLFRNTTNSTTAFQIQDSAGTGYLLTADTSNGVIKVGTTASATQAGTALFATAAEFSGALRVGDATNRVQVDGTSKKITYVGTARQDRRVTLTPEYAGATLTADGSNNVGTMTSDFCSGSSRLNLNTSICGSTDEFNYYSWIGSGGTMDYDIYVRWQVPSDFDGFKDATDAVKMYGWRTTSTEKVELAMFQANGTQCGSTTEINSSNTTWQETSMTGDETACSVSPNDIVTFRIKVTAGSSGYARASNIQINYLSKF